MGGVVAGCNKAWNHAYSPLGSRAFTSFIKTGDLIASKLDIFPPQGKTKVIG